MPRKRDEIRFRAQLHHTRAAITFYAGGDASLQLSVSADQLPQITKSVLLLDGATFEVVIPKSSIQRGGQKGNGEPQRPKIYR